MKHAIQKNKNGAFTLIELMVAIAIIGILAAVVLVSMQGYAKKARASRAMAQASSVIPSLVSCWGNGGTKQDAPGDICSGKSSYGQWPVLSDNYSFSAVTGTSSSSFYFSVISDSSHDDVKICCNSKMNSCGQVGSASAACAASTTW